MTNTLGKILIVDDDEDVLISAKLLLKKHSNLVHTENDPTQIPTLLKNEQYDVILLDMNFSGDQTSGSEGFFWLNRILTIEPSAVVILFTAYGDVNLAVRAIKEGATDFVMKPWENEKLLATLSAASRLSSSQQQIRELRHRQTELQNETNRPFGEIVGQCAAMQRVFSTIQKVAKTDANVLVLGENGTGKELVARALHRQSQRSNEVFISVDMGAITETLFESELFGHTKGAFTGAKEDRAGRFEIANSGTLFLDEIGNLSLPLQAKLLTAIQKRQVTRVGSNKYRDVDIRLICATNMPIHEMVAQREFRQDLLYRINTVEIHLPPLRDRTEDIPLLIEHFLKIYGKKYGKPEARLSQATLNKLQKYHWPGNIRELQHALERAVILSDNNVLQPGDFFFNAEFSDEDELALDSYNLEDVEKLVIRKAITKHAGNISKAARELGLTRASLYRRLEKYGL